MGNTVIVYAVTKPDLSGLNALWSVVDTSLSFLFLISRGLEDSDQTDRQSMERSLFC